MTSLKTCGTLLLESAIPVTGCPEKDAKPSESPRTDAACEPGDSGDGGDS